MATRPRRGKYMPIPVPLPEEVARESESESSAEAVEESSESSEDGVPEVEVVDMGGKVVKKKLAQQRRLAIERLCQGRQIKDDDSDEEEEDETGKGSFEGINLDEDDFLPPPTPRDRRKETERASTNIKDPQDIGKVYEELIDTCHKMEADSGFDEHFADVMTKNIETGCALFRRLFKETQHTPDKIGERGQKRKFGGPGDMYLAFLHTKLSSNVLRSKAERIGSGASIFSTDMFIETLKKEYVDPDGDYDSKKAAGNIAMEASNGTKSVLPLVAVVGAYDRDAVTQLPKAKKPRLLIRSTNAEEQQELEGDPAENNMQLVTQNPGTENMAKQMKTLLRQEYRRSSDSVNLFEFVLDKDSFSKTIENMFNLSFLVQKGHVSITKEENGRFKDLSLAIKPEKSNGLETSSPDEGKTSRNQIIRQKCILSVNSLMFKHMSTISQGENVIPAYPLSSESDVDAASQQQQPEHQSHRKRGFPAIKN